MRKIKVRWDIVEEYEEEIEVTEEEYLDWKTDPDRAFFEDPQFAEAGCRGHGFRVVSASVGEEIRIIEGE